MMDPRVRDPRAQDALHTCAPVSGAAIGEHRSLRREGLRARWNPHPQSGAGRVWRSDKLSVSAWSPAGGFLHR